MIISLEHVPEPSPSLYPTRFFPSTDARRLQLARDGEENDVLGVDAKIATQIECAIHGDVIVSAI